MTGCAPTHPAGPAAPTASSRRRRGRVGTRVPDAAGSELVEGGEQDRVALGDGLVREPLEHHRRAVRRRREPRALVGHAGLGASAELEAQLAQPCAVHVTGGCSNTTVTISEPEPPASAAVGWRAQVRAAQSRTFSHLSDREDRPLLWFRALFREQRLGTMRSWVTFNMSRPVPWFGGLLVQRRFRIANASSPACLRRYRLRSRSRLDS